MIITALTEMFRLRHPIVLGPMGAVSGLFLVGYGAARFVVEYAREPDAFLGTLAMGLTMGQWRCIPMIVAGLVMMLWAHARAAKAHPTILDRMK